MHTHGRRHRSGVEYEQRRAHFHANKRFIEVRPSNSNFDMQLACRVRMFLYVTEECSATLCLTPNELHHIISETSGRTSLCCNACISPFL